MPEVPFHVTQAFRQTVAGAFGDEGVRWLEALPEILRTCAGRWSLTVEPPFTLSYNYVTPATRADGTPVVLKVGCPNPEIKAEFGAMAMFSDGVFCELLEYDPGVTAMLLERIDPGIPLTTVAMEDDQRATTVAIDLLQRVWRPAPAGRTFPDVSDWSRGIARHRERFGGETGPLPARLVEEAEESFDWLLATTTEPMLLHGDFHHDNILSATRAPWLVIDPKGVTGDPGYDLGAFLYNPIPGLLAMPKPGNTIARRVDQLSEGLGMDSARVRAWGLAQAVLSACWSVDDDEGWRYAIACAEYLSVMRGGW